MSDGKGDRVSRFIPGSVYFGMMLAGVLLLPVMAHAQGKYYLEIGRDADQARADKQWKSLSGKYKSLLGKLEYFPKTVYRDNGESVTRIQAGPLETKEEARKICHKLFAGDTPCFVIENLQQAPPTTVTSLSGEMQTRTIQIVTQTPVVLPWLVEDRQAAYPSGEAIENQERESNSGSIWSWLVGDDDDSVRQKEAVNTEVSVTEPPPVTVEAHDIGDSGHGGDVEVAEAIRVPLSQQIVETRIIASSDTPMENDPGVAEALPAVGMLKENPVVTTSQVTMARRAPIGNPSSELVSPDAGWLNIATFKSESDASQTWQRVRKSVPEKAAGLRVRIVRPFVSEGAATTLNVGPFASSDDAMDFCSAGVKPVDRSLECMFTQEGAVTANAARYGASLSPAAGGGKHNKTAQKRYWVEVLKAPSHMEALNAWEDMRTANADLLGSNRSSISRLGSGQTGYIVRVGPMAHNDDAQSLCRSLRSRQVDCSIAMSSR